MKSDITIIGAGILGSSLAYFLSHMTTKKVLVLDHAPRAGYHTSSRNTGKVHAPFLYDPQKKKLFAKSARLGFTMWETYAKQKNIAFKKDGVLEVALDEPGIQRLEKYMSWGEQNGLDKNEISLLDSSEVKKLEPEVVCQKAIFCKKDASVDYGILTENIINDAVNQGVTFLPNTNAQNISDKGDHIDIHTDKDTIQTSLLINAAGGMSIDIAHIMGVRKDLTDIHFRGEYWEAEPEYKDLTKTSVYSVPKHLEYPFLDPHWIVRSDGRREVGPNAVPVFSPYGYDISENVKKMIPKMLEMLSSGASKMLFDSQFISLASGEFLSSVSKTVMINRVREFLPKVEPKKFKKRGTAGIRASVIDRNGKFVPDALVEQSGNSVHILNYNSPGATGALPFAVYIISQMQNAGLVKIENDKCGLWSFEKISQTLE
ncbi:FAD dependent oxidoreductase [Nitrosotalea sinensis]|uniref:FAD dependent oxidoreductase n=1 Tax=Nitrosotalea sinensis TaxID=1499975 RepID=A0A2H1EEA4_9ARCH|nr:FAD-dependent oxidoreductase [Candidatus Nitrosotalea sinensis]SHO42798.1 FAD dependent oxidoreductase [Candidatus Nitrosotalea sinensis]